MVDKVWSDWQLANPENFWLFKGGSVQATQNLSYYEQYPNGGPPMLSVGLLRYTAPIEKSLTWLGSDQ